ncbi:SRPBCC family protein [Sandarakinorhabdus sp. DWP1-3-1]|uniref:SRPBCC family protein n=1 Tax=Sandarakinorhabdus sp. DWP1-3-1 TaxID=2804627 RepID=UPI003CE8E457
MIPLIALLLAAANPAPNPAVSDTSFVAPDGARTLQQSIVIDAPVPVLWKAFTDATEFQRWSAPVAAIDLKTGGSLEATYDDKHAIGDPDNIRHRIVTYLPNRLIVFQNTNAPAGLPGRELFKQVVAVLEYEPLGPNRTKVTLSQTGWGPDPASDTLYRFFQSGNAASLAKMKRVYEAMRAPAGR